MNHIHKTGDWILDLIFPSRCIGCHYIGSPYICFKCFNKMPINKSFRCINCGLKTNYGITCLSCSEDNAIDQLLVVSDYGNSLVKNAIRYYKYSFIKELANPLSDLTGKYIRWLSKDRRHQIFNENTIITAVPLHKKRNNWRGFNQSELIAKTVADRFLVKSDFGLLTRAKMIKPQAEIENRDKRISNVIGGIVASNDRSMAGSRIIIVDDVSTTGSTLNACARVLKEGGAKEVIGLVIARG